MPRGKKNSTTPSTTSKTANKTVAEPIKEKAAVSETKSVKPTAKKKAAAPKKAATKTRTTKKTAPPVTTVETGVLKSAVVENAEKSTAKTAKKVASKSTKKATLNTAKKTSAAATGIKKPAVKKTVKGKSDEILVQSSGKDYTLAEITETCKNAYRGGTRKQIKSIKVYVKAEGNQLKAYYVVNDNISGSVDL